MPCSLVLLRCVLLLRRPSFGVAVALACGPALAQPITPREAPLDLVRFRTDATVRALPPGDARCTAPLPSGVRACLSDRPDASTSYVFTLLGASGTPFGRVVSAYYSPSVVPAFDLARFALPGGAPLYVLVARAEEDATRPEASRWNVYAFESSNDVSPLRFATAEYAGAAFFPAVRGQRMLMPTAWEGDAALTGPHGLRLTGRTVRYENGALVPEASAPVVSRLWTDAFAAERRAALTATPPTPAWNWADIGSTRTPSDPQVAPLRVRTNTPGRLGAVSARDDGHPQVAFLPDTPGAAEALVPVFDLADGPTQRLLPDAYAPRGGWAAYLAGRRARLVTYVYPPAWTDANAILWLER